MPLRFGHFAQTFTLEGGSDSWRSEEEDLLRAIATREPRDPCACQIGGDLHTSVKDYFTRVFQPGFEIALMKIGSSGL